MDFSGYRHAFRGGSSAESTVAPQNGKIANKSMY